MKKEDYKKAILKKKPVPFMALRKLFSDKPESYWKLKQLVGDDNFRVESWRKTGWRLLSYGIYILGEDDEIHISNLFRDNVGPTNIKRRIVTAFDEMYDNFVENVEQANLEELKELHKKINKSN